MQIVHTLSDAEHNVLERAFNDFIQSAAFAHFQGKVRAIAGLHNLPDDVVLSPDRRYLLRQAAQEQAEAPRPAANGLDLPPILTPEVLT